MHIHKVRGHLIPLLIFTLPLAINIGAIKVGYFLIIFRTPAVCNPSVN